MPADYSIEELDTLDDSELVKLDWKNLTSLNARLLELHAEGALGNEKLAKLPLRPILCIDQIERIDDEAIEASFTFSTADQWAFDSQESLEMLFQDQLDQLVGFWGCRKADGIGRALSSGSSQLHQSLDFKAGKKVRFVMEKRKWMENKVSGGGGTAVFNGRILDSNGAVMLETRNVIVGILRPEDIDALRKEYGGLSGVDPWPATSAAESGLRIPVYDEGTVAIGREGDQLVSVTATQKIDPKLWPLRYHFRDDPVVPGNFGTHGMIALLKQVAGSEFNLSNPVFQSLLTKKFSGMIFEDTKQIRFELKDVALDARQVVAKEACLYLENSEGARMKEEPIYTFKNLAVG